MKTPSTIAPRTFNPHQAAALAAALGVSTLQEFVDNEHNRMIARSVTLNGEPARLEKPSPNMIHPLWTVRAEHDSAKFTDSVVRHVLAQGGDFVTRESRRFACV